MNTEMTQAVPQNPVSVQVGGQTESYNLLLRVFGMINFFYYIKRILTHC